MRNLSPSLAVSVVGLMLLVVTGFAYIFLKHVILR